MFLLGRQLWCGDGASSASLNRSFACSRNEWLNFNNACLLCAAILACEWVPMPRCYNYIHVLLHVLFRVVLLYYTYPDILVRVTVYSSATEHCLPLYRGAIRHCSDAYRSTVEPSDAVLTLSTPPRSCPDAFRSTAEPSDAVRTPSAPLRSRPTLFGGLPLHCGAVRRLLLY